MIAIHRQHFLFVIQPGQFEGEMSLEFVRLLYIDSI